MKINATLCITINSGAALVIFVICFFALLAFVALSPAVAAVYAVALTGLTGAFTGFLLKRNSNNKLTLESEKLKMSAQACLTGDSAPPADATAEGGSKP